MVLVKACKRTKAFRSQINCFSCGPTCLPAPSPVTHEKLYTFLLRLTKSDDTLHGLGSKDFEED